MTNTYISVLSSTERGVLFEYLSKYLTDSELVSLVSNIQDERERTKSEAKAAAKRMGPNLVTALDEHKEAAAKLLAVEPVTPIVPAPASKGFVEPPGEAAARITKVSQDQILRILNWNTNPAYAKVELTAEYINQQIKGKLDNTKRILKLLWVRDLVVFDGKEYFLA